MGWLYLALIGIATAALLWRIGIARDLWAFVAAALLLGAAGYALQARPTLVGHPVEPNAEKIDVDPGMVAFREAVFGRFTGEAAYMTASDAMLRSGDSGKATAVLLAGIRAAPTSVTLWTGLGSALAKHDGGQVSPAALFAFRRAARINPRHPGPPFFLGLAYVEAGQFQQARDAWRVALALAPPGISYRPDIESRLATVEQFVASGAPPPGM